MIEINLPAIEFVGGLSDVVERFEDCFVKNATFGHANDVRVGAGFVYKIHKLDGKKIPTKLRKEARVLFFLDELVGRRLQYARYVGEYLTSQSEYIFVQERIHGCHKRVLRVHEIRQLIEFLSELHAKPFPPMFYEFEQESTVEFSEYFLKKPQEFINKIQLSSDISDSDQRLLAQAKAFVDVNVANIKVPKKFALIHKDLSLENMIFVGNAELALLDWEAAMIAPLEWEFAIVRQRFSGSWNYMKKRLKRELNEDLIDVCGVTQALRFWKSFPHDEWFVYRQKEYIQYIFRKAD